MTYLFLNADAIADVALSLDTVWMLLAAMLVFFMQPGFALCEAGFTRSKNTANILFKNFVRSAMAPETMVAAVAQNTVWKIRKPSTGRSKPGS